MGVVSAIGAIPVTAGYLSHALSDLLGGAFVSAFVWIIGYLIISEMVSEIKASI